MVNVDKGRMLGSCGGDEVKCGDVVSGHEGFPVDARLSGGREARIEPTFMVFMRRADISIYAVCRMM